MAVEPGTEQQILEILANGAYQVAGQFVYGSNYTFLVDLKLNDTIIQAVYKPIQGERPLWDFPHGSLAQREAAAYYVCRALGWHFVPITILRQDGPAGPGSLQQYVELDPERHYFNMSPQERAWLKPVALFDALINNADRKGGHVLLGPGERIWLIDHGLCFHQEHKLRTVIWDFARQPIPDELLRSLTNLLPQLVEGELAEELAKLISPSEIKALRSRCQQLLSQATFPAPGEERHYPWPLV